MRTNWGSPEAITLGDATAAKNVFRPKIGKACRKLRSSDVATVGVMRSRIGASPETVICSENSPT
jgi:hypothetical protein